MSDPQRKSDNSSSGSSPVVKDLTWDLALVTTQPIKKRKRRFCFKLQGPEDTIIVQAFTSLDMDEWLTLFTNHNAKLLGETECSEKCADCGAGSASWISLNWSVFLCLKCSGVHRQLSSSVSKVRSISLDHLHPWLVALHTSLGDLANGLLLKNAENPNFSSNCQNCGHNSHNSQSPLVNLQKVGSCPKFKNSVVDSDSVKQIDSRADEQTRSIYITKKYVQKEWATKDPVPDPFLAIKEKDLRKLYTALNFGKNNDKDSKGLRPIHAAICSGVPELSAMAVACSNDLDQLDDQNWTPLQYAIFTKQVEIAKFLIAQKVNAEKGPLLLLSYARGEEEIFAQLCTLVHEFKVNDDDLWLTINAASLEYVPVQLRDELTPIEINSTLVEEVKNKRNQILHL